MGHHTAVTVRTERLGQRGQAVGRVQLVPLVDDGWVADTVGAHEVARVAGEVRVVDSEDDEPPRIPMRRPLEQPGLITARDTPRRPEVHNLGLAPERIRGERAAVESRERECRHARLLPAPHLRRNGGFADLMCDLPDEEPEESGNERHRKRLRAKPHRSHNENSRCAHTQPDISPAARLRRAAHEPQSERWPSNGHQGTRAEGAPDGLLRPKCEALWPGSRYATTIKTGVPILTWLKSHSASLTCMRMQPWETE